MSGKLKKTEHSDYAQRIRLINPRIGIVVSVYHKEITERLCAAARKTLKNCGVKSNNIITSYAPGAYELPLAASWLHENNSLDAVIVLGCVIKGDTDHNFYINSTVSQALMQLSLSKNVPFIFGVLTVFTLEQALERAGGKLGNKGEESALAAIDMILLRYNLTMSKR
ncbi:MAG: 6,7-dimethyl-8-ribityllumazine synthase [Chitinophagales bacterium]|nr:6,7-dimethyl-8-ribityllumazine synthase [Chitinophagales bacterium]MDW8273114.1 6,7-dimethyl-8-ribityllumazine synthase [Chitinophagales bacterium]